MNEQMIIRVDPETKQKFIRLARREGRTASHVMREMIQAYVREHDIAAYVDDLWTRIGHTLELQGVTVKDVAKAIRKVRARK